MSRYYKKRKNKLDNGNFKSEFLEATRVVCKCGHVVNFISNTPYIECTHCHQLIFRNNKAEYDFRLKRRFGISN